MKSYFSVFSTLVFTNYKQDHIVFDLVEEISYEIGELWSKAMTDSSDGSMTTPLLDIREGTWV